MAESPKFLRPVMSYYGGKWKIAPKYPAPIHETVIEPFAGGAGYSLRHYEKKVILYDLNPIVCGVWEFLIKSTHADIMRLPLLEPGQTTDDLAICQEAKWLIGFNVNAAVSSPCKQLSAWGLTNGHKSAQFWGERCRERMAISVAHIGHWKIYNKSYQEIPNQSASWFIDPPYQVKGTHYPCGSDAIDFSHLGRWCQSLNGQVMVCENAGADWLPFASFMEETNTVGSRISKEAIWTNEAGAA